MIWNLLGPGGSGNFVDVTFLTYCNNSSETHMQSRERVLIFSFTIDVYSTAGSKPESNGEVFIYLSNIRRFGQSPSFQGCIRTIMSID